MQERIIENNQTGECLYFISDETVHRVVSQTVKQEVGRAIVLTFLASVLGFCLLVLIAAKVTPRQCVEPYPAINHQSEDHYGSDVISVQTETEARARTRSN